MKPDWDGIIIGVTGPARAGKGTVARMVIDLLAPTKIVRREGFADRLKLSAARALGYDVDLDEAVRLMDHLKVDGEITFEHSPVGCPRTISGREFLQRYGTESHRDVFGQDFWVEQVLPDPLGHFAGRPDAFDVLVIDDLRFENEARRIRECGGVIWRVQREHQITESGHVSEAGLPDDLVDRIIDNSDDLEALLVAVAEALAPLT